jgi:hypothetical protein
MKRKILIAILALGTVGGYAAGFASMGRCGRARRESFERHVAKVCVDAARGRPAQDDAARPPASPGW